MAETIAAYSPPGQHPQILRERQPGQLWRLWIGVKRAPSHRIDHEADLPE